MELTLVLIQYEGSGALYLWNGKYPVGVTGGHEFSQGPWHPSAEMTDKEIEIFTALETNKKRVIEFKDRGRFNVLSRTKAEIETES